MVGSRQYWNYFVWKRHSTRMCKTQNFQNTYMMTFFGATCWNLLLGILPSCLSLRFLVFIKRWRWLNATMYNFMSHRIIRHNNGNSHSNQFSSRTLIFAVAIITLYKKWSFSLRISSVNVTKSAVFCAALL